MSDPTLAEDDDRDSYEYADDIINQLLEAIERVQHLFMLDRRTTVRIVAILFETDEARLLRLTGERP